MKVEGEEYRALWFENNTVKFIDQRKLPYKFEILDIARKICNGENRAVFRATQCNSIEDIRNTVNELKYTGIIGDDTEDVLSDIQEKFDILELYINQWSNDIQG